MKFNSHLTDDFIKHFQKLPSRIKKRARKSYKLWKKDPNHASLKFKKVSQSKLIYSIRVGIGWRALGLKQGDTVVWFWIGSHSDYDKFLKQL